MGVGLNPPCCESASRMPWALSKDDFTCRAKSAPLAAYTSARDETSARTDEIVKIETEIDARVKSL